MQIGDHCVVTLAYTLRDDAGSVLDQADPGEPFTYLHGRQSIVPGLERALAGAQAGESRRVSLAPADAYGERNEDLVQVVGRDQFDTQATLEVGMQFHARDAKGQVQTVRITGLSGDEVTVDANHPLAGVALHFEVEVLGVRPASAEELAHGHAHGPGGHGH